jgi:hypothetical protein
VKSIRGNKAVLALGAFAVRGGERFWFDPEWHDMKEARNRFSLQNRSPKEPVRAAKNIFTSEENTYRKACTERKKAPLQIRI